MYGMYYTFFESGRWKNKRKTEDDWRSNNDHPGEHCPNEKGFKAEDRGKEQGGRIEGGKSIGEKLKKAISELLDSLFAEWQVRLF